MIEDYGGSHPFTLDRVEKRITGFEGTTKQNASDGNYLVYHNYAAPYYQTATFGHLALPALSTDAANATKAFARTNPSRPSIDLPTALVEMRELPELFRWTGKYLIHKGADAFLSYQYGWKPLIRDMHSTMMFSSHFRKRMDEVRRSYDKGGLRSRFSLGSAHATGGNAVAISSDNGDLIQARATINTTRTSWATVRWYPDNPSLLPIGSVELENAVRRAIGGLTPDLATTWNLIPWSWLTDWFGTMGDFLIANRNYLGYSHSACHVMHKTITTHKYTPLPYKGAYPALNGGEATMTVTSLRRGVSIGPTVTADVPCLTGQQLSILGALGIRRVPRGVLSEAERVARRAETRYSARYIPFFRS